MRRLFSLAGLGEPQPTGNSGEWVVKCPECPERFGSPDPSAHLGLNTDKGIFNCIRCGYSGVLDLSDGALSPGRKSELTPIAEVPLHLLPRRSIPGFRPIPECIDTLEAQEATNYLVDERGLTTDMIVRYSIGISPDFPGEIIFPYFYRGRIIFYCSRNYWKTEDYWTFPRREDGWPGSKSVVYGARLIPQRQAVVITEGVFDAIICPRGVATQSNVVKPAQMDIIMALQPSVVVVFQDSDISLAAKEALAERFKARGVPACVVQDVPEGEDPASLGTQECRRLVRAAITGEGGD